MNKPYILRLLVVVTLVWNLVSSLSCPPQCHCDTNTRSMVCSLTTKPVNQSLCGPSTTEHLRLTRSTENSDWSLLERLIQCLPVLKTLDLSGGLLSEIPPPLLSDIGSVTALDLSNNKLSAKATCSLHMSPLIALTSINLSGNDLTDVGVETCNLSKSFSKLRHLNLSRNDLSKISMSSWLGRFLHLNVLDLSDNKRPIRWTPQGDVLTLANTSLTLILRGYVCETLTNASLPSLPQIKTLDLRDSPSLQLVQNSAFHGLSGLTHLYLQNCPYLRTVSPLALEAHLPNLRYLDLSRCSGLTSMDLSGCMSLTHVNLSDTRLLRLRPPISTGPVTIDITRTNRWNCSCDILWLTATDNLNIQGRKGALCAHPDGMSGLALPQQLSDCSAPSVGNESRVIELALGAKTHFECDVAGDPYPDIVWIAPSGEKLIYRRVEQRNYPTMKTVDSPEFHLDHTWHDSDHYEHRLSLSTGGRLHLLSPDGHLFFDYLTRRDPGVYTCFAVNPLGNATWTQELRLDYALFRRVYLQSLLVGLCCAGGMLALGILGGVWRAIRARCSKKEREKRQTVRKLLESIEAYRSHKFGRFRAYRTSHMDRLRDQYSSQMNRFKDGCISQIVNMQDNYNRKINNIKENCENRIDSLRESYNQQMGKIKDYRSARVERLRDNYNLQVLKIREYAGNQLDRLREQYRQQQQHLVRILGAMTFDTCVPGVEGDPSPDLDKFPDSEELSSFSDGDDELLEFPGGDLCLVELHEEVLPEEEISRDRRSSSPTAISDDFVTACSDSEPEGETTPDSMFHVADVNQDSSTTLATSDNDACIEMVQGQGVLEDDQCKVELGNGDGPTRQHTSEVE